jgi:hypothetical protein
MYKLVPTMSTLTSPLIIVIWMNIHLQEIIIGGLKLELQCVDVFIGQNVIHNHNGWNIRKMFCENKV